MLYSKLFQENNDELLPKLQEAIAEIQEYYNLSELTILQIDDRNIGVPLLLNVNIPSGGTVGNIDIREQEPIVLKINRMRFPDLAPSVMSDRPDFPKNSLSHLYVTRKGSPAHLCLVRGNVHEWFAGKRMENLLDVIGDWFHKAAAGKLNEDGNEFDPLRLDSYTGYHSYRYTRILGAMSNFNTFFRDASFACLINTRYVYGDIEQSPSFQSELLVQAATIEHVLNTLKKITQADQHISFKTGITLLIWNPEQKVYSAYEAEMPKTYDSFVGYFKGYDIDIESILQPLRKNGYLSQEFIPVIHAIRRPKKMIGFPGDYELVNFAIEVREDKKHNILGNSLVFNQDHIEPFSSDLAKILTGENRISRTLFVGAGSLGSKMIMHDVRSGKSVIGFCDDDDFLQHNLARHALYSQHVGKNKSSAIALEVNRMLEAEPDKSVQAYPLPAALLAEDVFPKYNWLVDSSASQNVQNWLSLKRFASKIEISRCEIVNGGQLGLLYIEGANRNPRIDDLVFLTYFRALTNRKLQKWRLSDALAEPETLNIGLGCSSISTIMADDIITQHAAVFSRLLHNEQNRNTIKSNGLIFINALSIHGIPSTSTSFEMVRSFDIYRCQAGSGWDIRLINGLMDRLLTACKKSKPKETGGLLIGVCNYKTKSIHIFDVIYAPTDSKSNSISFIRGVAGLPEKVDQIKYKTGGMIGYIGEWHTHPMQLEALSERDKQTIQELIPVNQQVPIPTLSLIVTNTNILPFVFI